VSGLAGDIYTGEVVHRRFLPRSHHLRYSMFQILIDIDAAPDLDRALRLFSHNRFNLFAFHDADHGEGRRGGLRAWVDETLAAFGIDLDGGEVRLLCMPRMLGHVFNPLSLYFCQRRGGELAAMIYEVNNTHGERHFYVIPTVEEGGRIRQSCAKTFYVSPFMDMDMTYDFTVLSPGERIAVTVEGSDSRGERLIAASFCGRRGPLTDATLAAAFASHPLLTLKVVAAIRIEAMRLVLKGLRARRWSPAPRGAAA
jgi:DUF1365 family protein